MDWIRAQALLVCGLAGPSMSALTGNGMANLCSVAKVQLLEHMLILVLCMLLRITGGCQLFLFLAPCNETGEEPSIC